MQPTSAIYAALDSPERLQMLRRLGLLDSPIDPSFDRLTRLATRLLQAPIALVTLVDSDRQFFKSSVGLPEPWASQRETSLLHSFCQHVVVGGQPFVVANAHEHALVRDNLAIRDLGVIAYAGFPLETAEGHVIGAFCAIDSAPRAWTESELQILSDLSVAVMTQIALGRASSERAAAERSEAVRRRCLEQLATGASLDQVLATMALGIEAQLEQGRCAIMLVDSTETYITTGAAPSLPQEFCKGVDGAPIGPSAGSCGTAAYLGTTVICEDIGADPIWERWRDFTLSFGLRASWSVPFRNSHGKVLGTFAVYYDVPRRPSAAEIAEVSAAADVTAIAVERWRTQHALQASEAQYRLLAEHMDDVVTLHDLHWRYLYLSPSHTRLNGYTPEELIGRDARMFVHPEDIERASRIINAMLHHANVVEIEWRCLRRDGTYIWLSTKIQLIRTVEGRAVNILCVSRNVTARRRAEDRLRRSEANLSAVFENAPEAIWSSDHNHRLTMCNSAFGALVQEVTGRQAQIGDQLDKLLPGAGDVSWQRLCERALAGEHFAIEVSYPIQGTPHWYDLSLTPIRVDGDVTGVSFFARDITQRREQEHQRLSIERVWQETQRLESLGVLAGGIAHDFNNLLAAVQGNLSLALMDVAPTTPIWESLMQAEQTVERASSLTQQLLAYAGKGRFVIQPLSLNPIVEQMARLVCAALPQPTRILQHLAPDLPLVEGDEAQLRQVVMNLIMNAAESLDRDDGVVAITTRRVEPAPALSELFHPPLAPGSYVWLEVIDNGIGMNAETLARIFEPFFTTKFTGRGLGLSAVQGIVRSHRGGLRVQSTPNEGTSFVVALPAADGPDGGQATAPAPRASQEAALPQETILVIDDEDDVRRVTSRILGRIGYATLEANGGPAALSIVRAAPGQIACALLDWTMPGLSGTEVVTALRELQPDLRIVLMSGYSTHELSQQTATLRLNGFLQKPFRADELVSAIRTALQAP